MSKRLAGLCGIALALAFGSPASAQIIVGGKAVKPSTDTPAAPVIAIAPAQGNFPLDSSAADFKPISVAAPSFSGATPAEAEIAAKVTETVRAHLASVGVFTAPDSTAIADFTADIGALPAFADWSGAGVSALLLGKAVIGANDSITVQFRLYDIAGRKELMGKQYTLASSNLWRRVANKVADDVLVALVGGKAGFDSRIAFAAEVDGRTQLWTVEQDGTGAERLASQIAQLQAPRNAPNGRGFVYSADAPIPGKPNQAQRTTIMFDLATGRHEPLTTGAQPNADARYSPDGFSLIYSRKEGANTDIYIRGLHATDTERRLTDDKATDTQPTLSPDATKFAFISDRAGSEAVYVARVNGEPLTCSDGSAATACRLTTGAGTYFGLVWSPAGDEIAFARRVGDQAAIHAMKSDGSGARALTTPGRNELDMHPSWSPDGRRIAFSRVAGSRAALHIVAVANGNVRRIDLTGDVYEPDWSAKLP